MSKKARECTHSQLQCLHCGSPIDLENYNLKLPLPQIMQCKQLCFSCAYWIEKVNRPDPYRQIINGEYYVFFPNDMKIDLAGHNKQTFYIMLNNGNVIRSRNVWHQGEIPLHLRELLPDTARFISRTAYYKIKNQPLFKCKSKGCWDRYHCFWYDIDMEVDGPWNEIPNTHKVGDECCESFLDKIIVYE